MIKVESARGFTVGQTLRIWAEPIDVRVIGGHGAFVVLLEWPWRTRDPESSKSWQGMGFPLDPDSHHWKNTPWRLMPPPEELRAGGNCYVGIPPTLVRVVSICDLEGPADYGYLPRPEWQIGLCPIDDLDDEEAGYVMYPDSGEPIEYEVI